MNLININKLNIEKDFLSLKEDNIKIIFSSKELNRSFNRNTNEGLENLKKLKHELKVDNIIYLNQTHSNTVLEYKGENIENFIRKEGDGILTRERNTAITIFTADCVPIIALDKKNNIIGAAHSGWKGTYNSIAVDLINYMNNEAGADIENIKIYIGPHIKQCCYEVSEELKEKFIKSRLGKVDNAFNLRNLSMEEYIIHDLLENGIKKENIYSIDLCTKCSESVKLHSHRGSNGDSGRMVSVVYIK